MTNMRYGDGGDDCFDPWQTVWHQGVLGKDRPDWLVCTPPPFSNAGPSGNPPYSFFLDVLESLAYKYRDQVTIGCHGTQVFRDIPSEKTYLCFVEVWKSGRMEVWKCGSVEVYCVEVLF